MLEKAKGILVNGVTEGNLIRAVHSNLSTPVIVAGVGIDIADLAQNGNQTFDFPYLLYMGRLNKGKGVYSLIDWFKRAKASMGVADLRLCLAGQVESGYALKNDADIHYCGVVPDEDRLCLCKGARLIVNPSPLESLSLLALEAMAFEKPLLLNERCDVFRYYASEMDSCFLFSDESSFRERLREILEYDWASSHGRNRLWRSRQWLADHYSWDRVLSVYRDLFTPP